METCNLFAPMTDEERHALYARLRGVPGLCRLEPFGAFGAARYSDASALLKDPVSFSSEALAMTAEPEWLGANPVAQSMLTRDPPAHTRLRASIHRAFGPAAIARLERRAREVAERLAEALVRPGPVELVEGFTSLLPRDLIGEMLGLEPGTFVHFKRWSMAMAGITAAVTPEQQEECRRTVREMNVALQEVIEARRRQPTEDMVSELLRAEPDGGRLSDEEVLSFLFLLLPAGMDTTTQLLGNALLQLARHPEHLERIRTDETLLPRFIEEVLRYEPPSQISFRMATRDVELSGTKVPAGSLVFGLIASANRDERVFDQPERFLPGRARGHQHLSFGYGIHFCLGAQLARLEARVGLEALVSRIRGLRLTSPTVEWIPSLASHGPAVLHAELTPA